MDRFRRIFRPMRIILAAIFFGTSIVGLSVLTVPMPNCVGQISTCGDAGFSDPLLEGTPEIWAILLGVALLASVVLSLTATRSGGTAPTE